MASNALPDYVLDPNAVLKDSAEWRHKRVPNYDATRADYIRSRLPVFLRIRN